MQAAEKPGKGFVAAHYGKQMGPAFSSGQEWCAGVNQCKGGATWPDRQK
ncbi:MAG: hypothetical protein AB9917_22505 [Negativicutes bacterium]